MFSPENLFESFHPHTWLDAKESAEPLRVKDGLAGVAKKCVLDTVLLTVKSHKGGVSCNPVGS